MTHNRLAESHADRLSAGEDGLTVVVENLKIRTIDPPVAIHGRLVPLSEIDPEYAAQRDAYLRSREGTLTLRVQKPDDGSR
jgi:hypothetical protein